MSDHGFERKHTNIHINDFLLQQGYLRESESSVSAANIAVQTANAVGKRSSVLYEKIRQLYNYIISTEVGQTIQEAAEPNIDYPNSKAWQLRYGCVFINDERFDHPTVDDPDALRRQLQTELAKLTDDDGSPLFRDVFLAEEAYTNPDERAPDIIARPAPGCYPTLLKSPTGGYASDTNNFNHRYKGLFAATGPLFAKKTTVETPSIVDVLPTVMAVLGVPLSPEFDGGVIETAVAGECSVEYRDPDTIPHPRTRIESDQEARDEAVQERLEDLGYLE